MSRVSRKSDLSPSITKGSSGIDLGKNSGVDMGQKSQPSVTSGGIGVTQEITNIGGLSVTGGVSVDIFPLNFGISADPSEGSISVGGGAEIPGGILGISGGVTIDTNTGEIIGGSIGGEVGGIGINVSNSKEGGLGVEITVQIPGTPIEISLGFGFPPKKKEEPTPPPSTTAPINLGGFSTKFNCSGGNWEIKQLVYNVRPLQPTNAELWAGESWLELARLGFYDTIHNPWGFGTWYEDTTASDSILGRYSGVINGDEGLKKRNAELADYWLNKGKWIAGGEQKITSSTMRGGSWYWDGSIAFGDIYKNVVKYQCTYTRPLYISTQSSAYIFGAPSVNSVELQVIDISPPPRCPTGENPTPGNPTKRSPSPPNPPPTKRNMDECCRDSIRLLRGIYKGLGVAKFPGKLPSTIIQEIPKEGEQPAEPPQVPIEDFVDLLDWQFRRDDERWGQWVVQIDVKDADLTKEGDRGKQIKFPNLGESIAELEGQMLSVMTNVDALVAITTKNLVESGMARQESIKSYLAAKAIIKYMAFKSTEVDTPVPMTFTPGAETISELIKESEGHIKGTDYVEKETLRDIFLDLLQAAAITRAVHWQKIDSKNDTKTQLLNLLKGTVDLAGLMTNAKKGSNGENKFDPAQNFEDFIDSVEDGFRNTTGISDIQNPYGRTPDRRPRIREIGDNLSEAGGDK